MSPSLEEVVIFQFEIVQFQLYLSDMIIASLFPTALDPSLYFLPFTTS